MNAHLLIGAVGGPNFGDEAILSAWIRAIRKADPAAKIFCDGYNLSNLGRFLEGITTVLKPDESLWRTLKFVESKGPESIWDAIDAAMMRPETLSAIVHLVEHWKRMNIAQIHFVGGGYFNSLWPHNYVLLVIARIAAWACGARLIATGQGLEPLAEENKSKLIALMSTFDLVDLRDQPSFDLFSDHAVQNLSRSGDDALLHFEDLPSPLIGNIPSPALVICLQNDLFAGDTLLPLLLNSDVLERFKRAGINQIIMAEAMPTDTQISPTLIDQIRAMGFTLQTFSFWELLEKGFPVHPDGFAITSRYHPHLFCALSGMRGIAVASNAYYELKHSVVREFGSTWPIIREDFVSEIPRMIDNFLTEQLASLKTDVAADWVARKSALCERVLASVKRTEPLPVDLIGIWKNLLSVLESERAATIEKTQMADALTQQCATVIELKDKIEETLRAEKQMREAETLARQQSEASRQQTEALLTQTQSSLREVESRLEQMRASQHEVEVRLKQTQASLQETEARLKKTLNSFSWRITHPFGTT